MTMFSMKPKFDLAEFLATPAPKSASRARGRGMKFQGRPAAKETPAAAESAEAKPADPKV